MARRRFELHHYRQALLRVWQDDSGRDIAAARVMGRPKAAQWRRIAGERGWLDAARPLPDDGAIAEALDSPERTPPSPRWSHTAIVSAPGSSRVSPAPPLTPR